LVITYIHIEIINDSLNGYIKEELLEEAIRKVKEGQLVDENLITKAEAKLKRQVQERVLLDKLHKTLTTLTLHSSNPSNDMISIIRSLEEVLDETNKYDTFCIPVVLLIIIGTK